MIYRQSISFRLVILHITFMWIDYLCDVIRHAYINKYNQNKFHRNTRNIHFFFCMLNYSLPCNIKIWAMDGQQTQRDGKSLTGFWPAELKNDICISIGFCTNHISGWQFFLNIFYTCMKGHNTPHYHKTIKLWGYHAFKISKAVIL